jgi:magnesium transporter
MAKTATPPKELEHLQEDLREVQDLLRRNRLVESMVEHAHGAHRGPDAPFAPRQGAVELRAKLDRMHLTDIAYILEAVPLEERLTLWDLVKADRDGEIPLKVSEAVRESLIASMDSRELVAAAETLEADKIADLAPDLPDDVFHDVFQGLPVEER